MAEAAMMSFIIEKYSQCSPGAKSQDSYKKPPTFTADKNEWRIKFKIFFLVYRVRLLNFKAGLFVMQCHFQTRRRSLYPKHCFCHSARDHLIFISPIVTLGMCREEARVSYSD